MTEGPASNAVAVIAPVAVTATGVIDDAEPKLVVPAEAEHSPQSTGQLDRKVAPNEQKRLASKLAHSTKSTQPALGPGVSSSVGMAVGKTVGSRVGVRVGAPVGSDVGLGVRTGVGAVVGIALELGACVAAASEPEHSPQSTGQFDRMVATNEQRLPTASCAAKLAHSTRSTHFTGAAAAVLDSGPVADVGSGAAAVTADRLSKSPEPSRSMVGASSLL